MNTNFLFTIGHSNRSFADFGQLLKANGVTAVADVRSQPYSRHAPHFNRRMLQNALKSEGFQYVFLGDELGARRSEACCYVNGQASYDLIQRTPAFQRGLERIRDGLQSYTVVLMCAEKDPITCHRTILVARALRAECEIRHIIGENQIELHSELEQRLLHRWNLQMADLFTSPSERLNEAYQRQATEIAYIDTGIADKSNEPPQAD